MVQEQLAFNGFLDVINDPQLEYRVRQRTPANLDQAVVATLELETYLLKMSMAVVGMNSTKDASIAATASMSSCFEYP